ncbi:hypothetical protein HA402_015625 [Bradysia odoriphaga]|nr:hypothetical protein HA402_015625 [Bradysia odoriphaga]
MSSSFKTEEDVIKDSINNKKPTIERDLTIAKSLLKQKSGDGGNVYDHLTFILSKIIDERPKNVMDHFEEFSRVVQKEKNRNSNSLLASTYVEPDSLKRATSLNQCCDAFFQTPKQDPKSSRKDDFAHLQFYWSIAGYGFPQGHIFTMSCSLGLLASRDIVRTCRYWGRIFGLKLNYHVAEADLSEDEMQKRATGDAGPADEQWGSGINQKTYFVCHCLGDDWIELPRATAKDIEMSQKIRKHFTGDLDALVQSNPKFPGAEKNLLRATIQRITTETYAAPVGYYEVEGGNASISTNYKSRDTTELLDLSSWCQYRMTKAPLCSESSPDFMPWTLRHMHEYFPTTSMVVIRSNVWPGAVSFFSHLEHDSLYVGWGVKYGRKAFIPPLPLSTSNEYNFNVKAVNEEIPGTFNVKDKDSPADD